MNAVDVRLLPPPIEGLILLPLFPGRFTARETVDDEGPPARRFTVNSSSNTHGSADDPRRIGHAFFTGIRCDPGIEVA
ncbi:MAG: hypothetical protein QMD46_04230 [Methanomicrobiales archaeon]|nr:hypothetical protein [Methanomicrobiales archaeon]MDI6876518.1 hypothetical protein [Methanomicrobiales archaeon]